MDNHGNSRANACAKTRLLGRVVFISDKPTQAPPGLVARRGTTGRDGVRAALRRRATRHTEHTSSRILFDAVVCSSPVVRRRLAIYLAGLPRDGSSSRGTDRPRQDEVCRFADQSFVVQRMLDAISGRMRPPPPVMTWILYHLVKP